MMLPGAWPSVSLRVPKPKQRQRGRGRGRGRQILRLALARLAFCFINCLLAWKLFLVRLHVCIHYEIAN